MPVMMFWNIAKKTAAFPCIVNIAVNQNVDIIFLAECPKSTDELIVLLNQAGQGLYDKRDYGVGKIRCFSRIPKSDFFAHRTDATGDVTIWNLGSTHPDLGHIQVASMHLSSKAGGENAGSDAIRVSRVADFICRYEDQESCFNTVIMGDMNMSPWEAGLVDAGSFYAVMTKAIVNKNRVYRKEERRKFYNPMWGFFGDRTPGPPGTHCWGSSKPYNSHWYIYDQVLLRPPLIENLINLEILEADGVQSLLNPEGFATKEYLSDHLPLLLELDV